MMTILLWACERIDNIEIDDNDFTEVVFVCQKGSVKSLMAATLFDNLAKEQNLPYRALSRGLTPDESVPPMIVDALKDEGVEVAGYIPQKLSLAEVQSAERVIAIGVDLSAYGSGSTVQFVSWDAIPPASLEYEASRASMLEKIQTMIMDLSE